MYHGIIFLLKRLISLAIVAWKVCGLSPHVPSFSLAIGYLSTGGLLKKKIEFRIFQKFQNFWNQKLVFVYVHHQAYVLKHIGISKWIVIQRWAIEFF